MNGDIFISYYLLSQRRFLLNTQFLVHFCYFVLIFSWKCLMNNEHWLSDWGNNHWDGIVAFAHFVCNILIVRHCIWTLKAAVCIRRTYHLIGYAVSFRDFGKHYNFMFSHMIKFNSMILYLFCWFVAVAGIIGLTTQFCTF